MIGFKVGRNNSHCKLNLRMDGADDGTVFTDSSGVGNTITPTTVVTKTAVKKFGTASGYFDGNGDYLTLVDSDDWHIQNNYTIEFWFYLLSFPYNTQKRIMSHYVNINNFWDIYIQHTTGMAANFYTFVLRERLAGTNKYFTFTKEFFVGTWYHIGITKYGANIDMFLDGIRFAQNTTDYTWTNFAGLLYIGRNPAFTTQDFNGYIDSLLISKGVAKYTRNFTPPNRAA